MKKIILSIVAIGALVVLPMSVFAQAENTNGTDDVNSTASTVSGTAKIISPIKVVWDDAKLDFGTITKPTAETSLALSYGNEKTANEIWLASSTTTVPGFTVTGDADETFGITLPEDGTITLTGDGAAMAVNSFTSSVGVSGLSISESGTFTVGATLVVNANQAVGTYSGSFDVTVYYE